MEKHSWIIDYDPLTKEYTFLRDGERIAHFSSPNVMANHFTVIYDEMRELRKDASIMQSIVKAAWELVVDRARPGGNELAAMAKLLAMFNANPDVFKYVND